MPLISPGFILLHKELSFKVLFFEWVKAGIQIPDYFFLIHFLADKYQLDFPVPYLVVPVFFDSGVFFHGFFQFLFAGCCKPITGRACCNLPTCLLKNVCHVVFVTKPDKAFRPYYPLGPVSGKGFQFFTVKGLPSFINKG